uniref:DDE Tnp4 domain-containing protein n=1 Tax=Dendroctonus ponderosae TaxID=77166 RepID=J3JWW4_DENPD|nr:unknown [Dendroctonus ponderosae]
MDYCFTFIDVGAQGRMNDAGVFASTTLYRKILRRELSFPPNKPLPGRHESVPYIFVGDDAFPLSGSLLKAYSGTHAKGSIERIFNYRLCRARRVVENVFGILASIFRVFRKPMLIQPEKAAMVCMTCALLHNFLRRSNTSRQIYTPSDSFDYEADGHLMPGSWRQDTASSSLLPLGKTPRKPSEEAKYIRKEFAEYFVSNGAVEWQSYVS